MIGKILKQDLRESLKSWLICTALVSVLFALIYTASGSMKSKGGFLVEQYFTMFATVIPLVYVITTANRLVVNQVDDGSFFMVMVSGYKRSSIILTKIVYYVVSILAMHLVLTAVSVICVSANPLELTVETTLLLNLYAFLITLAISSICFFASVFFNSRKNAAVLGTGFPLVSYLLYTLSHMFTNIPNLEDQPLINALANLKYVSVYSLFNYQFIVERSSWLILIGILLFVAAGGIFTASSIVFRRKDLCL